ncbi:MAG: hypothetical protein ACJATT_002260 [Myxococcota bacterium]|jgi:hypothetical protein
MSELIPPTLTQPGVYPTELLPGSHEWSLPADCVVAFLGPSAKGRPFWPKEMRSVDAFDQEFGADSSNGSALAAAARAFFGNGGEQLLVVRTVDPLTAVPARVAVASSFTLVASSVGEWANGLRVEMAVDIADPNAIQLAVFDADAAGVSREIESWQGLNLTPDTPRYVGTFLARESSYLRVADPMDGGVFGGLPSELGLTAGTIRTLNLSGGTDGSADAASRESALTTAADTLARFHHISLLAVPGVTDVSDLAGVLAEVNRRDDLVLLLDSPQSSVRLTAISDVQAYRSAFGHQPNLALYTPWVRVDGPAGPHAVPPSGFMAGVIARSDIQRGVFHTPAGLGAFLQGASGLSVAFDDSEQAPLNALGVNVIRSFPDAGVVAWAARTLSVATDGSEHLPVHRMAQYVRKAVVLGTAWAAVETHGPELWTRITSEVETFLRWLFEQGAFAGVVHTDSYRVQCDAGNNPPDQVELGILIITVEFAMFRIGAFHTVVIEHAMDDG